VRLIYVDEAGISNIAQEPFLVVAGVLVDADKQFKSVEAHLDGLVEKYIPKDRRDGFAFHAMELFHGTRRFDRQSWSFEKRLEILDELASIPKKFDLPICFGITDRASVPMNISEPASPPLLEGIAHAHAFFKCAVQAEIMMRGTANFEVGMIIAEDRDRVRAMLKMSHALMRGRVPDEYKTAVDFESIRAGLLAKLIPFERIVETVHFAQKVESSLLQVADICAFAIKRDFMKASHSSRLYDAMREYVIFRSEIMATLSSASQLG
jgi:hypothetical protein